MGEFSSIQELANEVKNKLDSHTEKRNILAAFAFNTTGKTRLTSLLAEACVEAEEDGGEIRALRYDAFLEDVFRWDNESYILSFDPNSWISELVKEQGLENNIVDTFNDILSSKIQPIFDFENGKISFTIATGDDTATENIKISRGEESMLIWSVFFTVLTAAIEILNDDEANRTTQVFNGLQYVFIDDPVSSMDDTRIVIMAVKLVEMIKSYSGNALKFFITTHHALFFNVITNSLRKSSRCNFKAYCLSKEDNYPFKFLEQRDDSLFSYHLLMRKTLQDAINNNGIEKYHFNLFRALLEKTASFLGYANWADCISGNRRLEFIKLLNLYSHGKLADVESRMLSGNDKALLEEVFNTFMTDYRWNQN